MKKEQKNNISKILVRNLFIVLSVIAIIFLFIIIISVLALKEGLFFKNEPQPVSALGNFILISFILFVLLMIFVYTHNRKIIKAIKSLEDATARVAKGDFKIQLPFTDDANINSYIYNFNKMVKELDGMQTLKEDFISNVSHEFKTPLSVIQSYTKALRKNNLDAKTKKQYEEVLDTNIKKLTNLTTNILNLSKLEHQEIVLDKKEFLLDEQIRQCIVSFEPEWSKKNIDFNLDLPKTTYYGSEDLIAQIWQNIIGNAIKFCNQDGKIDISITTKESEISVTITDNGIGMSEEVSNKIFEKFYQGDTSHSSEGNGLGLALVNRILKICKGKISIKSKENEGSTFTVNLPIEKETK